MLVKEWTKEEELFLIDNYPNFGAKYCSEKLKRPLGGIRRRARILKIKWKKIKNKYHKDYLQEVVKESTNIKMVLQKLNLRSAGGNYKVINRYINEYNLDISHFDNGKFTSNSTPTNKKSLKDVLVENSTYSRSSLKNRLYNEGILERKCSLCGQDENWNGMKISLIIDHINGIHDDNRIENLRIVCPNCNAGLDTFAGKNRLLNKNENEVNIKKIIKSDKINKNKIKHVHKEYCKCGNEKSKYSNSCDDCFRKRRRKVERPLLEELIKDIELLGYSATGRKYGVSDNSIRKWIKNYEKLELNNNTEHI